MPSAEAPLRDTIRHAPLVGLGVLNGQMRMKRVDCADYMLNFSVVDQGNALMNTKL